MTPTVARELPVLGFLGLWKVGQVVVGLVHWGWTKGVSNPEDRCQMHIRDGSYCTENLDKRVGMLRSLVNHVPGNGNGRRIACSTVAYA
jgi:hypothetical protein